MSSQPYSNYAIRPSLLEEKLGLLEETNPNIKQSLLEELGRQKINPQEIYQKLPRLDYELVDRIMAYFTNKQIDMPISFGSNLDTAINKEPLKRVNYGVMSYPDVPKEFLEALDPWQRIYFFAGAWIKDYVPDKKLGLVQIAKSYIESGKRILENKHEAMKEKGRYISTMDLPEKTMETIQKEIIPENLVQMLYQLRIISDLTAYDERKLEQLKVRIEPELDKLPHADHLAKIIYQRCLNAYQKNRPRQPSLF